jgi:hypothetical protein
LLLLAQLPTDLQDIETREQDIQDDEIIRHLEPQSEGILPIGDQIYGVMTALQAFFQIRSQGWMIFRN